MKPRDYNERNGSITQLYHEGGRTATANRAAGTFKRRIGSTNYRVAVHFSGTSRETMDEKIMRLVKSEVDNS